MKEGVSGPVDAEVTRRQWRREQRRIARTHHPDVGGEPGRYLRLMQDLDKRFGFGPGTSRADVNGALSRPGPREPVPVVIRTSRGVRLRRKLHRSAQVVRGVRARLPARMPGARRYIDL